MALRTLNLTDDASGHRHHLVLSMPDGAPPKEGWPLLCLLDGDWTWPLLHGQPRLEDIATLALGYGGDKALVTRCRAGDYTPPSRQGRRWPDPRVPGWQGGGAPAFIRFLESRVLPWLAGQVALDAQAMSLFGHSYGGLFTLYALSQSRLPFSRLICASPSLWWHDGIIHHHLEKLHAAPLPRHLDLIAGQNEAWYPQPAPATPGAVRTGGIPTLPAMRALHRRLEHLPGLTARLHVLPEAGHGAVLEQAARLALELALDPCWRKK